MKLKHDQIAALDKPGLHSDGQGLYLQIAKSGTKSWIYRYQLDGRRRDLGLGGFPAVSLSKARSERDKKRLMVKAGIDPLGEKAKGKEEAKRAAEAALRRKYTFSICATDYITIKSEVLSNAKHRQQWANTLRDYAYPVIGDMPVEDIDSDHIEEVLRPIWLTKTETATRVRSRIEAVLDYATYKKYRHGDNPARWKGNLDKGLVSPADIRKNVKPLKHFSSLPHDQLQAFLNQLSGMKGNGARALELTILCATRTSETLGAQWSELDLDGRMWIIPKERMKGRVEHHIPLSEKAVELLREQEKGRTTDYVFPGAKRADTMSNMAMSMVLRRMGFDDITVHGFRTTFRTWIEEERSYPTRVAETALAHKLKDKVEAAYNRTNLVEKRVGLMQDWASFCYPSDSNVIDFKRA